MTRYGGFTRKLVVLGTLLLAWEVVPRITGVSELLFPPFTTVASELIERIGNGVAIDALLTTLRFLLLGGAIGSVLAVLLTAAAILTPWGRSILEVLVSVFNPLPAIALLPLALLWFGFSETSIIFVIVMSVIWPITLNAYAGFSTIRPVTIAVGRNLGLQHQALIRHIYLPAALPHLLSGLRVGWAFAWRTAIAAELVYGAAGTRGGIGWRIYQDRAFLETAGVFTGLLIIIIVGLVVENLVFTWISDKTVKKWGMVT